MRVRAYTIADQSACLLERIHCDPAAEAVAPNTSQHTRGFYERLGFRTEHVVPDGYAPGLDRCDMRLILPSRERRFS